MSRIPWGPGSPTGLESRWEGGRGCPFSLLIRMASFSVAQDNFLVRRPKAFKKEKKKRFFGTSNALREHCFDSWNVNECETDGLSFS